MTTYEKHACIEISDYMSIVKCQLIYYIKKKNMVLDRPTSMIRPQPYAYRTELCVWYMFLFVIFEVSKYFHFCLQVLS